MAAAGSAAARLHARAAAAAEPLRRRRARRARRACARAASGGGGGIGAEGGAGVRAAADIESRLAAAVADEDFTLAARLRDELKEMRADAQIAVLEANLAFYEAFASGDPNAMAEVWAQSATDAQVVHPGAACIAGWADVDASWRAIFGGNGSGAPVVSSIDVTDVRCVVPTDANSAGGEVLAFVTCVENLAGEDGRGVGRAVATNIFRREDDGAWKILHHHASPFMLG